MKALFAFVLGIICPITLSAQDITGAWNGKLSLPNGISLTLVFHIEQTEQGYVTTYDSPDQGAFGAKTGSTTFQDSILTVQIPMISASYKGTWDADQTFAGIFTQGMTLPLVLRKGDVAPPNRPQEPQPPFPYQVEEVSFKNTKAKIMLAGTLTMPHAKKGQQFPAVVLVTGSGAQNRDSEIMRHKPFWVIADYLTRHGIAVLRCDDRGTAASQGNFATATNDDYVEDTEAALNYLRSKKGINPNKIGIIGHSCGGTVAFITAAHDPQVAFVVSLAGATIKGDSLMIRQNELIAKSQGLSDADWEKLKPTIRKQFAELQPATVSPWFYQVIKYDPTDDLKRVKCPVLALNGEKDIQVDADMNLNAVQQYVGKKATVKKYPQLNHLFQTCKKGTVAEYGELEETISPEVLKDIADWILKIK